tara:strand:+ start:258 stop:470 length:213 start_codon:yes stop_codon:yes gene_type:complete
MVVGPPHQPEISTKQATRSMDIMGYHALYRGMVRWRSFLDIHQLDWNHMVVVRLFIGSNPMECGANTIYP